tara:strand:- start:73 stop:432 length:360 start_codon:yes stop_codon:yes gene_type:complete
MAIKSRKNVTRHNRTSKRIKGGCGCDKDTTTKPFFSGGRKMKKRKQTKMKLKKRKTKKSRKRYQKGGAIQGYDMWSLAGLDTAAIPLKKKVLTATPYKEGNPLDQPVNYKYGRHHYPLV